MRRWKDSQIDDFKPKRQRPLRGAVWLVHVAWLVPLVAGIIAANALAGGDHKHWYTTTSTSYTTAQIPTTATESTTTETTPATDSTSTATVTTPAVTSTVVETVTVPVAVTIPTTTTEISTQTQTLPPVTTIREIVHVVTKHVVRWRTRTVVKILRVVVCVKPKVLTCPTGLVGKPPKCGAAGKG